MKFLEHISYTNIDDGIEYLKEHPYSFYLPVGEITIYHVYWYGKLGRHEICCICSYLCSQDLDTTELWVWLDRDTYHMSDIPKHINIKVKMYDPKHEAIGTPFIDYPHLDQTRSLKFRSDIFRILALYKYGGIYFDLDMLLLKDLKSLLNLEFCYSWSDLKGGNNAILRLKKHSILCKQIIEKYKNTVSPFNLEGSNFFIGYNHKYIFTQDIDLTCLPCVFFDPVWILFDRKKKSIYSDLTNLDDFFRSTNEDINKFFDNQIYAYHIHSRNNMKVEKDSYFEKFEDKFKLQIQ